MTVTRKDLNLIASTFNQQILLYADQKMMTNAQSVWFTAESMYHTMVRLNPNVQYSKWRAAVLADTSIQSIFNRRAMTDRQCEELAMDLFENGADSETVTKDVLTLDILDCTDLDWQEVLMHLGCIEVLEMPEDQRQC
tara:strand:+ start:4539 stop:4952 length:414 start_codon:yes stop_codon:yes gene_type:complete